MNFLMTRIFAEAGVSEEGLEKIASIIRTRSLEQGEYLFRQGDTAPNLYLIRNGLAKMSYITSDGKEFVKSFLPEGSFAGSLIAQMENCETTFSIVCLEPVEVEIVPFRAVQKLFERDPAALDFGFRFFQALALKKEKREYSFLCLAPEERYQWFLKENPTLADRVTKADIARYLGITPVALSRIRRRMKEPVNSMT